MQNILQGRVVVVTGGAGGIGRGIAEAVLEEGGRVALLDLGKDRAAEAAAAIGKGVLGIETDVTDAASLEHAFEKIVAECGGLWGLVNNAGVVRMGPAEKITDAGLDLEFAVNVRGVLLASQAAARRFGTAGGAIVNVASNAGKVGYRNMAGYNATKAAVINLTRSLALEWAEKGINVNAVCPGGVATDMLKTVADFITGGDAKASDELYGVMFPQQLGRHVQPVEVGRIIAFLLSDAAKIIRGQSINIDGGDTPY